VGFVQVGASGPDIGSDQDLDRVEDVGNVSDNLVLLDAEFVEPERNSRPDEVVRSFPLLPGIVVLGEKSGSSQLLSFRCCARLSQFRRACSCVRGSVLLKALKDIAVSPLPYVSRACRRSTRRAWQE
jgi:hypothetical protein